MNRGLGKFFSQIYAIFDFLFIQAAFIFSWWLKFESGLMPIDSHLPFSDYQPWSLIYGFLAVFLGFFFGSYVIKRKSSFISMTIKVIESNLVALLLLLSLLYLMYEVNISRYFLAIFFVSSTIFITVYRLVFKGFTEYVRKKGYNKHFILVLGAGSLGRQYVKRLKASPELGYDVIGFLDDRCNKEDTEVVEGSSILGKLEDLEQVLTEHLIDEVVIALPLIAHHKYGAIINVCEKYGVKVVIIPDYFDILPAKPYFDRIGEIPLINVRDVPLDEMGNQMLKRLFDIMFSLFAIILTLPLMIIIAITIKVSSSGPIIFKQERVGLNRRTFKMYKFRTMRVLPPGMTDTGWTTKDDPRKTRFGSYLRKTSLDELPQFFNVLFGDMSVVGPRPERPLFVEQFKEQIPKYMVKHHVRPGITGWAQASGLRGDTSIEKRINHDIFYIENWSFMFDIKIIGKTMIKGFLNKNAY